jgi:hypothetical protein
MGNTLGLYTILKLTDENNPEGDYWTFDGIWYYESTAHCGDASSSSSSSSHDIFTRKIEDAFINEGLYDLLPFTWTAEGGYQEDLGDNSKLNFTIQSTSSPYLSYEAIINRDNAFINNAALNDATVYVPESLQSKYKHEKSFYVDIIAKDDNGIRDFRTHVEPNKYDFKKAEDAEEIFVIPKFTWRNR